MSEFWSYIDNLSPFVQGVLGSALFWTIQLGISSVARRVPIFTEQVRKQLELQSCIREYTYRKFTSRNGLVYYTQGYFLLFSRALRHIVEGLVFMCAALLLAGVSPVAFAICVVGGLWFFGKALTWLVPSSQWSQDDSVENWDRVASLEEQLFGKVEQDTLDFLEQVKESAGEHEASAEPPEPETATQES